MITLFKDKSECCGCGACNNICPKNAISMKSDEKGFAYPKISSDRCIECGLCKKVCPITKNHTSEIHTQHAYAVKHKDEKIRKTSSSGGAFYEIALKVINEGGKVYGAAYDENFVVKHIGVSDENGLKRIMKSKYVQSDMGNTFSEIKMDLENNLPVLFSGTGCQVQGLRNYLVKEYDKLLCVDIVCHGVPSPKLFADYLKFMENKYKSKITSVNFRGKAIKGKVQDMLITFENGKVYSEQPVIDSYYAFFLKNFSLRESCYKCPFSNLKRVGDITLADFWGIEKEFSEFQDYKGVSLVITNTLKGEQCLKNIFFSFEALETSMDLAASQQPLRKPFDKTPKSDLFWQTYLSSDYAHTVKKFNSKPKLKYFIKKIIK